MKYEKLTDRVAAAFEVLECGLREVDNDSFWFDDQSLRDARKLLAYMIKTMEGKEFND